jgi:hypothetical protein
MSASPGSGSCPRFTHQIGREGKNVGHIESISHALFSQVTFRAKASCQGCGGKALPQKCAFSVCDDAPHLTGLAAAQGRARAEGADARHCRLRPPPGSFGHRADGYGRRLARDAPPAARRRRAKPRFSSSVWCAPRRSNSPSCRAPCRSLQSPGNTVNTAIQQYIKSTSKLLYCLLSPVGRLRGKVW